MHQHIPDDTLERYALGYLNDKQVTAVEEHLLICPACASLLDDVGTVAHILRTSLRELTPEMIAEHDTSDGRIELYVHMAGERWVGRIRGRTCDAGVLARTRQQAIISVEGTFWTLFPEHRCSRECINAHQRHELA